MMTTPSTSEALEVQGKIAAKPATVFPFLSDGAKMALWFGTTAEIQAKPGGHLRVDINGRDIAAGEVVEVVADQRIVFTFGWEGEGHPIPPGSSKVEITLAEDGDGTLVRLRHTGLPAEAAKDHKDGWVNYMPRLAAVVEGRDPGPNPHP